MTERKSDRFGGIFISYRRRDSSAYAGRIYDRLCRYFPYDKVFIDVDNIDPGEEFSGVLQKRVNSCTILLAIIGPRWADEISFDGVRRLEHPTDYVRTEIESALTNGVRVIPVLVDSAEMPNADLLPDSLKPLAFRQATDINHHSFGRDFDRLLSVINKKHFSNRKNAFINIKYFLSIFIFIAIIIVSMYSYKTLQNQSQNINSTSAPPSTPIGVEVPAIECDNEPNLRSPPALSVPSNMTFINMTSVHIKIYWLDGSGSRVFYSGLDPDARFVVLTYLSHPWLITDNKNICISIYVAQPGTTVAYVKHSS